MHAGTTRPLRRPPSVRSWALIVGLATIVVGCASAQPTTRTSVAVTRQLQAIVFHDANYESDGSDLSRARQALVRRCMARRGFAFDPADEMLPLAPAPTAPSARAGYGLFKSFKAADRDVLRDARDPAHSRNARYVRALPARRRSAYQRALIGLPTDTQTLRVSGAPPLRYRTGGCYARALASLDGSLTRYYGRIATQNAVAIAVNRQLVATGRRPGPLRAWRSCMRDRGLRYRNPGEARDALFDAYMNARRPADVWRQERMSAAADRACGQRSAFYDDQQRAWERALRSLPARDVSRILAAARSRAAAARRARKLLRHR